MMTDDHKLFRSALCTFFFLLSSSVSEAAVPHPRALVAPINKDDRTALYTIPLNKQQQQQQFVLDITGNLLWSECHQRHPLIPCRSHYCTFANTFRSPLCQATGSINKHPCTCSAAPLNSVTQTCAVADLTYRTDLLLSATDGRVPTRPTSVPRFVSACAPKSLFKSLPAGVAGMAGLGRSRVALPSQLANDLSIQRQFAICLPGTSSSAGVAFFGDGPYFLLPASGLDVTNLLSFTPLIKNPVNPGYYIDVKAVAVNGELVRFLARMLMFDAEGGGGVKLSTVAPYTTLKSHVYRAVLKAFAKATHGIPRAAKVTPFDLCLNTSKLGSTRVGLPVPQVDLILPNGQNWTIFGANSMKQVSEDVACLAVVNGGEKAQQAAVIGSYQLENNFLLFDLAKSRLGFSSTLFFFRTTCSNFNFTS
ncbi:chitinase CLP-like [Aristolochia californica]|uniref:chitinase CLP-like n=1 Tax=Aristolochia californica TaxID=171875 RepID=UPI0035DF59E0